MVDVDFRVADLAALAERSAALALNSGEVTTELVIGEQRLLSFLPEIHQLRIHCGQLHDLTTDPNYFIAAHTLKNRRVAAVLIRRGFALEACVLFFEHCLFGVGLGLMRGGDGAGGGIVTGTKSFEVEYIHLAAQALLRDRRTHGVSLTVRASLDECVEVIGPEDRNQLLTQRNPRHRLMLTGTYGEMLAAMGPRTRRSLAGKRRQLEEKSKAVFLPRLEPDQALDAMLALRSQSWPVRIVRFCHVRYRMLCEWPEFFSTGLRLPDGTWLSFLSGWRRDGITFVDLQMNRLQFKKESISGVMRAFLMEHEISLGQDQISFVGGCSVLLGRYCEPGEPCTDVVLWRPGLRSAIFKSVLPWIKPDSTFERVITDY